MNALVGRGFQADLVHILAPEELSPGTFRRPSAGGFRNRRHTRGYLRPLPPESLPQTVQNFIQRLREFCQTRGINFFTASSNTDLQELLLTQLRPGGGAG